MIIDFVITICLIFLLGLIPITFLLTLIIINLLYFKNRKSNLKLRHKRILFWGMLFFNIFLIIGLLVFNEKLINKILGQSHIVVMNYTLFSITIFYIIIFYIIIFYRTQFNKNEFKCVKLLENLKDYYKLSGILLLIIVIIILLLTIIN